MSVQRDEVTTSPEAAMPIPPIIQQSLEAFRRDLAQLLRERPGQWVAYSGDRRLGFGRTKTELYQECLRQGYDPEQFVVDLIEPGPICDYISHF
jgi:hypothetical protein